MSMERSGLSHSFLCLSDLGSNACKTNDSLPLPDAGQKTPAISLSYELAEQVILSMEDPSGHDLWQNWRLVSRNFYVAVETLFAHQYLREISIRIVLENPPTLLYFRLWNFMEDENLANFRVCKYGPGTVEGSEDPEWGMSMSAWHRTTMAGWKKRWRRINPGRPLNMAVVELNKQQKFMELPDLLVKLEVMQFECHWRKLLSRFFRSTSRKAID